MAAITFTWPFGSSRSTRSHEALTSPYAQHLLSRILGAQRDCPTCLGHCLFRLMAVQQLLCPSGVTYGRSSIVALVRTAWITSWYAKAAKSNAVRTMNKVRFGCDPFTFSIIIALYCSILS